MERDYYPCTPNVECPFYSKGCFEDVHHLHQVEKVMTDLMRLFRNLPENLVDSCRRIHRDVLDQNPLPYPDEATMRQVAKAAHEAGEITLSKHKQRVVYGTRA